MSQSVTFFQFDEANVKHLWDRLLESNFSTAAAQTVHGLTNLVRHIQQGDYDEDLIYSVWELDDLIVNHFSHRHFHQYEMDVRDTISFWLATQTGKSLDNDFSYNYEAIDPETWQNIFTVPKKLTEVRKLAKDNPSLQIPLSADDLLDNYLQIKAVFEYNQLTDTEMLSIPEDRSLSPRWTKRISTLQERAQPVLITIRAQSKRTASEYKKPPFITIPLTAKEFFIPIISVIKNGGSYSLEYEDLNSGEKHHYIWASRVLPGETYEAALQRELNNILGYTGGFQVIPMKALLDQAPDNSGALINRYTIQVKLLDSLDTNRNVMGHKLSLTPQG